MCHFLQIFHFQTHKMDIEAGIFAFIVNFYYFRGFWLFFCQKAIIFIFTFLWRLYIIPRYQSRIESNLGILGWNFSHFGPPWYIYVMPRTVYFGWICKSFWYIQLPWKMFWMHLWFRFLRSKICILPDVSI